MSNVVTMVYDPEHTVDEMRVWMKTDFDLSANVGYELAKISDGFFIWSQGYAGSYIFYRNPASARTWQECFDVFCTIAGKIHDKKFTFEMASNDDPWMDLLSDDMS